MAEGRTDPQRRWTLVNEGEHDFAHLSYDGPPIKVGERVKVVEVVPADDRLTVEELKALSYEVGIPVGAKDAELFAKLRRLAGREDCATCEGSGEEVDGVECHVCSGAGRAR